MKSSTKFILFIVAAVCFVLASAVIGKYAIESSASTAAKDFNNSVTLPDMGHEEKVYAISNAVFQSFITSRKKNTPWLLRLRPYFTNELLPEFVRVKKGAIDSLFVKGMCDNAARTLIYLLEEEGYKAWQFNINSPYRAHAVTLVELPSGQTGVIDPLYGVASYFNGHLISPEKAQLLQQQGTPREKIWKAFASSSNLNFYKHFDQAVMAIQGRQLTIEITAELKPDEIITLGKQDGLFGDVSSAAKQRGWTPHWHYIGHRYDRGWERIIKFPQRTRITFNLTKDVIPGLITSQIEPSAIRGSQLIYEIDAGGVLHFRDGQAKRDWLSLRSYQDVDYIQFENF